MKTIGFIGLGLIGGSVARTIRKFHRITICWLLTQTEKLWQKQSAVIS